MMYQNGQVILFNSCRFWHPWQRNVLVSISSGDETARAVAMALRLGDGEDRRTTRRLGPRVKL